MYSSIIAVSVLVITVLLAGSYQYEPEFEKTPEPRDPPNQSKKNTEHINAAQNEHWACAHRNVYPNGGFANILFMRWPDRISNATHKYENQSDLWFDRLVYIHHEGHYDYVINNFTSLPLDKSRHPGIGKPNEELSITLNGVIIDDDRVLTSYNPFRQVIKYAFKRHFTHVCALYNRRMERIYDDSSVKFRTRFFPIACARQVVPLKEHHMPENLWHGKTSKGALIKQHSPLHDLMVLRIHDYFEDMTKDNYDYDHFLKQREFYYHGPQKTYLAKKDDIMGSDFKFAMMGHIFGVNDDRKARRNTYVGYYNKSDNVVTNCDEWIPREWGWFICVLNKKRLPRLASGAALYSRNLLFGIGSFTLFKGDASIIVFTDVRPYESLINDINHGPCTTKDQFENPHLKKARSADKAPSRSTRKKYHGK